MNRIELFKFERGDEAWYYTNSEIDVTYSGNTYESATIGRNDIEESEELSKSELEITMALDSDLSQDIITQFTERFLYVTVYIQQNDETTIAWRGRHTSTNPSGMTMVMAFESNFTALGKYGLTKRYQISCPHRLYSTACGVNKDNYASSYVVSDVNGVYVTLSETPSESDGYFKYGMIEEPGGLYGYIIGHSGATITMQRAVDSLTSAFESSGYGNGYGQYYGGLSVTIYPGCMKSLDTCHDKFDNVENFGGFPWIPDVDITNGRFI